VPIVDEVEKLLPNLPQKLIVDGAGHWVEQKRPDDVNAALMPFQRS
jgi:pimeloyl-ACP methyl ester carboxylesterase